MGRDFETRRLAAFLNISTHDVSERYSFDDGLVYGECLTPLDGVWVEWRFQPLTDEATENKDAEWILYEIVFTTRNEEGGEITLDLTGEFTGDAQWEAAVDYNAQSAVRRLAARVCYCLEVEDKTSWKSLNYWLSAQEKLELRLSIPREFWPQKWLDEQATSGTVML